MNSREQRLRYLIYISIALATLAVYWQVTAFDFAIWDDHRYVKNNPHVHGISGENLHWAFTSFYEATWQPLTWISYMVDHEIAGPDPGQNHETNLLLHVANSLLLLYLLMRLTGSMWRSAFVAALFALHPLHVESVAWIAERKDVLSTFFMLLTILAYVAYVERPEVKRYLLVVFAFAFGLMSKPMLVTLPVMLLLLDYWPMGRLTAIKETTGGLGRSAWKLVREKLPLLAMSAGSALVTYLAHEAIRTGSPLAPLAPGVRLANVLVAYMSYLGKTLCPTDLVFYYPHPGTSLPAWQAPAAGMGLILLSVLAILAARRRPYILVGWFWYVITLLPVIGIVDMGIRIKMADRFSYVPLIGIFIIIAWGLPDLMGFREFASGLWDKPRKVMIGAAAAAVLVPLAVCTNTQAGYWSNAETLRRHALAVDSESAVAHCNLGVTLLQQGKLDSAKREFSEAVRIDPGNSEAQNNLGSILARRGRFDEAIEHFQAAVKSRPKVAELRCNLGCALIQRGKLDEGIERLAEADRLKPGDRVIQRLLVHAKQLKQRQLSGPKQP